MPVNGFNVGRDYSFGVYESATKTLVNFGDIQDFKVEKQSHNVVSRPYNGVPRFGYVPDGYKGTFTIVRTGVALENLQIQLDALFNTGSVIPPGYINETITNPDGTVSRFQFVGVMFVVKEDASGSREKEVKVSVEWMASDKVVLA